MELVNIAKYFDEKADSYKYKNFGYNYDVAVLEQGKQILLVNNNKSHTGLFNKLLKHDYPEFEIIEID